MHAGLVSGKQGARTAKPFIEVAYGYLPLVWGITLAHYLLPLFDEAGRILPVRPGAVRTPCVMPCRGQQIADSVGCI